jgi:F-type H+-transporting ATPase subunit a
MSNSEGMHSPVEQFEIKSLVELSLGGYDVSFTNSSLFMLLAIGVSAIFLISAMRRADMVPGRMQGMAEMMYEFVAEMVRSNVGSEGRPYFPFIFTLFVFLLFGNMLGLIPYSYTFTSQIIVTFAMAGFCVCWRDDHCAVQARPAFLQLFRSSWRAKSADPLLDCH